MIGTAVLQKLTGLSVPWRRFAGKVEGWWRPFAGFMSFSLMDGIIVPKKSVAVSIERGLLWVVLGTRFLSRMRIVKFRKYAFEEGRHLSPESLAGTLSVAIKELKVPKTGITLSIPKDWVIVRTVELPSTVKADLGTVMAYELDRLTPLSSDSAYYDFKVLNERDGRLSIVVVAARADLIDQYLTALKKEGIGIERVTINLSGLGTFCSYIDPTADSICMEVDSFGYEGGFIHGHTMVSAFGGSFSGIGPAERTEVIRNGIEPVFDLARSLGLTPAVYVYMKDKGELPADWCMDCPMRALRPGDVKLGPSVGAEDISYVAIGAAFESLWSRAKGLNLLGKGNGSVATVPRAGTFVLILLLLAAWVPYAVLPVRREEARLNEINRQISLRKEEVRKVEALKKEVDALSAEVASIEDFKEGRHMALALLKELTATLPKTVWLTRTRIAETQVDIEGYANSASEILPKLEQTKYFRKVEFMSPTIRDTRMNADRFVVKMEIKGQVKEPVKEAVKEAEVKAKDDKKK